MESQQVTFKVQEITPEEFKLGAPSRSARYANAWAQIQDMAQSLEHNIQRSTAVCLTCENVPIAESLLETMRYYARRYMPEWTLRAYRRRENVYLQIERPEIAAQS